MSARPAASLATTTDSCDPGVSCPAATAATRPSASRTSVVGAVFGPMTASRTVVRSRAVARSSAAATCPTSSRLSTRSVCAGLDRCRVAAGVASSPWIGGGGTAPTSR